MKAQRQYRKDAREDELYRRIVVALVELVSINGHASKDEVLKEARAVTWAAMIRWKYVVEFVTTEFAGVMILGLTARYYASPRNKKMHSVEPGKYCATNYSSAKGFASVAQFVQLGVREREIALAKYSQQQIAASRALENAERLNDVIVKSPMPALRDPRGDGLLL